MKIVDFLNLEKPEVYDFTEDCTENKQYLATSGFVRFMDYRILSNRKDKLGVDDPDMKSNLLQAIYKKLWPELLEKTYMQQDEEGGIGKVCSDTMTSAWTPVRKYFEKHYAEKIENYKQRYGLRWASPDVLKGVYAEEKKVQEEIDSSPLLRFVSLSHTIGNYIPVPRGFNMPRSGVYASHDCWDLTMMKIREFYDTMCPEPFSCPEDLKRIMELLHYDSSILNTIDWLRFLAKKENGENPFDGFVKAMYLESYVTDAGEVKAFCKNHDWLHVNPDEYWKSLSDADFMQFFETASDCIEKRGRAIVEALKRACGILPERGF